MQYRSKSSMFVGHQSSAAHQSSGAYQSSAANSQIQDYSQGPDLYNPYTTSLELTQTANPYPATQIIRIGGEERSHTSSHHHGTSAKKEACCDDCAQGKACASTTQGSAACVSAPVGFSEIKQIRYTTRAPQVQQVQPQQNNNEEFLRRLNEIELLHGQEIREMQMRMENQMNQFIAQQRANEQMKEINDLRQSIIDLKEQQRRPSQPQPIIQQQPQQPPPQVERDQFEDKYRLLSLQQERDNLASQLNQANLALQEFTPLKALIVTRDSEIRQLQHQLQDLNASFRRLEADAHNHRVEDRTTIVKLQQEREKLTAQVEQLNKDLLKIPHLKRIILDRDVDQAEFENHMGHLSEDMRRLEQENARLRGIIDQQYYELQHAYHEVKIEQATPQPATQTVYEPVIQPIIERIMVPQVNQVEKVYYTPVQTVASVTPLQMQPPNYQTRVPEQVSQQRFQQSSQQMPNLSAPIQAYPQGQRVPYETIEPSRPRSLPRQPENVRPPPQQLEPIQNPFIEQALHRTNVRLT